MEGFSALAANALRPLIAPFQDGRKAVVFFLYHYGIQRIGHLFEEPLMLRTLFPADTYQIFGFHQEVPPGFEKLSSYRIATQGIHPLPLPDHVYRAVNGYIGNSANTNVNEIVEVDGVQFHFFTYYQLRNLFSERLNAGVPMVHGAIDPALAEAGTRLLEQAGIGRDEPLVVVHVREAGFANDAHFQSYRNADITSYVDAIRWLAGQGYRVVRIGDRTMRRLPDLGPAVVDAAHSVVVADGAMSDGLFEAWSIQRSRFTVGMASGPYAIALSLGTPFLLMNAPITWTCAVPNPRDLLVAREYWHQPSGRRLSFIDIAESALFDLIDWHPPSQFQVEVRDNPPELIQAATAEMIARLDAGDAPPSPHELMFRHILQVLQARRAQRAAGIIEGGLAGLTGARALERVSVSYNTPWVRLSTAYCESNPDFLRLPPA